MRILIAEDDSISMKVLSAGLQKWGHEVVPVSDGDEAWRVFEKDGSLRMAILDWVMPGKTGLEVCCAIKACRERPFTYVLMLTGRTEKEDLAQAMEIGADDYVTKPFDAVELKARIRAGERIIELESVLQQKVTELERALSQVKQLEGFLPICAWCKRVRDDNEYWGNVEEYLTRHLDAVITHSICPECLEKKYGIEEPAN